MNSKKGRIIAAFCVLLGIVSIFAVVALIRTGAFSQETQKPLLFSDGYQAGEELAGFSGRPMILVFGDKSNSKWNDFLLSVEADPDIALFLKDTFVGVFVDLPNEKDVAETYDAKDEGTILVKDIHGPLHGVLPPGAGINELKAILGEIAPTLMIEKSPMYADILARGSVVLEELVGNGESVAAAKVVNDLQHFEPTTSDVLKDCETTASKLGILSE